MKRYLPFIMVLMTASAANAGALTHKLSSSVQLTVDAAATDVTRLGSTYSVSGSGVDTTDGTTVNTISTGAITSGIMSPGTIGTSGALVITAGGAGTNATGQFVSELSILH